MLKSRTGKSGETYIPYLFLLDRMSWKEKAKFESDLIMSDALVIKVSYGPCTLRFFFPFQVLTIKLNFIFGVSRCHAAQG